MEKDAVRSWGFPFMSATIESYMGEKWSWSIEENNQVKVASVSSQQ